MVNINPILSDTGLLLSDTATVKSAVEQMFKDALGQEMNIAADTPQGQLIASITAIIQDKDAQILEVYNNFNPATSSGIWQDALAAIYMLERDPALPTYVQLQCTGLAGTLIPGKNDVSGGALAKSVSGEIYVCSSGGYIGNDGTVLLQFESVNVGPIAAPANTVNIIQQVLPGWDSCNNPSPGVIGRNVESRVAFEKRRIDSVAINSKGTVSAIQAAVAAVDGVSSCIVKENTTSQPIQITGVTLVPHSIYVCAVGGTAQDIAQAIFNKKDAGCDYNGNTSVIVTDMGVPYNVKFQRPDTLDIKLRVTVVGDQADLRQKIVTAVMANFYGTDGVNSPVQVGSKIYASRFYCSLSAVTLIKVEIGFLSGSFSDSITLQIDQVAALAENNITVVEVLT